MKQLTAEQIQENWNKLIQLIKDTFSEEYPDNRREKLLKMYHHFESLQNRYISSTPLTFSPWIRICLTFTPLLVHTRVNPSPCLLSWNILL